MLTKAQIVRFDDAPPPPGKHPWVGEPPQPDLIALVPSDQTWPEWFEQLAARVRDALGPRALSVEHIGSTAVPGLHAKPIIDIDLIVADAGDEDDWLPPLEAAGFTLVVREPWWYEHRCLRFAAPACNLHVFSPDCAEAARHLIFRDWLRSNAEDRARYQKVKRAAAEEANRRGELVEDYNARKQQVIRDIYQRAFAAADLI